MDDADSALLRSQKFAGETRRRQDAVRPDLQVAHREVELEALAERHQRGAECAQCESKRKAVGACLGQCVREAGV